MTKPSLTDCRLDGQRVVVEGLAEAIDRYHGDRMSLVVWLSGLLGGAIGALAATIGTEHARTTTLAALEPLRTDAALRERADEIAASLGATPAAGTGMH